MSRCLPSYSTIHVWMIQQQSRRQSIWTMIEVEIEIESE